MDGAVLAFHTGTQTFERIMKELAVALEAEKQALQDDRSVFALEQQRFAAEVSRVEQVLRPGDKITLNVGGQRFSTSIATLRNAPAPSLFAAMFSGRHALTPDADGSLFIDRDPRHFHVILNYLRDGTLNLPQQNAEECFLLELRKEADFYGLVGLVNRICDFPFGLTTIKRAAKVSDQHMWEYDEFSGRDEVVFMVSKPVQLLGVGICSSDLPFTAAVALEEVEECLVPPTRENIERQEEEYVIYKMVSPMEIVQRTFSPVKGRMVEPVYLPRAVTLLPDRKYMFSFGITTAHGQPPDYRTETFSSQECIAEIEVSGVCVSFLDFESTNGTCQERGQFPELYIRIQ